MSVRTLLAALALTLGACGQPAPQQRAEAPALIDGEPCRTPNVLAQPIDLESVGAVGGYAISATPGALACSEPALDRVECDAAGPGEIQAVAQNTVGFVLDAGQTGTFSVGPEGPRCFLNASGE